DRSQARGIRNVSECSITLVVEKRIPLFREVGYQQIGKAVVIIIAEIDPHPSEGISVLVDRCSRCECYILEFSVGLVPVERFSNGVVRYRDIDLAVPVEIPNRQ